MATSADYLTLADAKVQLRIDDAGVAGDGSVMTLAVESAISAAIAYVGKSTGLPLLSADYTPAPADLPLIQRAVIVACREMFEGSVETPRRRAVDTITAPLRQRFVGIEE